MAGDTRERMVEAAVRALRYRGVAGMSFTEVLAESRTARGVIYHHFPGGKVQLVAEAAARNGEDIRGHLADLPDGSPRTVVDAFLTAARTVVAESTVGGGCAIAAVTVGTDPESLRLRRIAAIAFESWIHVLADGLTVAGLPEAEATDLATTLITLLEGAHVLCRAAGSLEPFEAAARTVNALMAGL